MIQQPQLLTQGRTEKQLKPMQADSIGQREDNIRKAMKDALTRTCRHLGTKGQAVGEWLQLNTHQVLPDHFSKKKKKKNSELPLQSMNAEIRSHIFKITLSMFIVDILSHHK